MSRNVAWPSLAAVLLFACVENPGSLIILNANFPEDQEDLGECTVSGGGSDAFLYAGVIDAQPHALGVVGSGYLLHPSVRNNLASSLAIGSGTGGGGQGAERELNHIALTHFDVELEYAFADGGDAFSQLVADMAPPGGGFRVPVSGAVEPGATDVVIGVEILPGDLVESLGRLRRELAAWSLNQLFLVHLQAVGTFREREVRSATFTFPVEVCYGCLVAGLEPAIPCEAIDLDAEDIPKGNDCFNLPQDAGLLCCWIRGGELEAPVCPAPPREEE